MKKTTIGTIAVACVLALPGIAAAQSSKDLIGTWKNVKNTNVGADGKVTDVFGPHGTGLAIFSADGHFAIVNINPDTPKFAANNRAKGTADENKAAVAGGIGIFGTYKVTGKEVEYNVEGSTYPNWTGTAQKREITKLTKDEFTWALTSSLGGKGEVTWKRLK
jgi:hypothetical protein